MKNVDRPTIPRNLRVNGPTWTKESLDELVKRTVTTDDKLFTKYNKADVKKSLDTMYGGICCYCEGSIVEVSYPHIEHRKPKSKYPSDTYSWENLHLSCGKCNTKKSNKYDTAHPILDAVNDRPVSDHMIYRFSIKGPKWQAETPRGKTTIEHTKLNRDELVQARSRIFYSATQLFSEIKQNPTHPKVGVIKEELDEMANGEYGSLVSCLKDMMLNDV